MTTASFYFDKKVIDSASSRVSVKDFFISEEHTIDFYRTKIKKFELGKIISQ